MYAQHNMRDDSFLNSPSGFSQIPIFHSVDRLLLDLSSPKFLGHFCICKVAFISGQHEEIDRKTLPTHSKNQIPNKKETERRKKIT